MTIVTRLQMTEAFTKQPVEALWAAMLAHGWTLQSFWERMVRIFAERTHFPEAKRDAHLQAIATAFDRMGDWRSGRVKLVKARGAEVDSAISFLRNKAIENANARLVLAPIARHAAGALRVILNVSRHGYHDLTVPELTATVLYNLAAVRTLFPFDISNLVSFHPGHDSQPPGVDPYIVMLERAGEAMGITDAVRAMIQEATRLYEELDSPKPLEFPPELWTAEGGGEDARLHYAAMAAFHRRT